MKRARARYIEGQWYVPVEDLHDALDCAQHLYAITLAHKRTELMTVAELAAVDRLRELRGGDVDAVLRAELRNGNVEIVSPHSDYREVRWRALPKLPGIQDVELRLGSLAPHERMVVVMCRNLVRHGHFPGPTVLNRVLHGHTSRSLNGRETRVRTAWLELAGYQKVDHGSHFERRWYHPTLPHKAARR